jgi:protein-L-isoaspartate(D-aspartate) O-methyltransferase
MSAKPIYGVIPPDWEELRHTMIEEQLRSRGIVNARVLQAMSATPRELFVPENVRGRSYEDRALSLGYGQTISQPYMVGIMLQALALTGTEKVLEVGTGTGYQAALLSQLARQVETIEIVAELADQARQTLTELGIRNVSVHFGDGTYGFPEEAPYDAIIVAAGAPAVPQCLRDQVREGGKLLLPMGDRRRQTLTLFQKKEAQMVEEPMGSCAFVPLRGTYGWSND